MTDPDTISVGELRRPVWVSAADANGVRAELGPDAAWAAQMHAHRRAETPGDHWDDSRRPD